MLDEDVRSWRGTAEPVPAAKILRIHKYRDQEKVRKVIRDAAEVASQRALELSEIQASFVVKSIENLNTEEMSLESGAVLHCPALSDRLGSSSHLLAFVVTLGPALDSRVSSLVDDVFEPLDALFLETAGWLSIEAATKSLSRELRAMAARHGKKLSLRMGPGYEYVMRGSSRRVRWDLEQQQDLFAMFGECELPVTLMSSSAMSPKMSRSGVFGLLPDRGRT